MTEHEVTSRERKITWYVYLLRCSDGTLYTGITTDVQRRLAEHNVGNGARYTRSRLPVTLLYTETVTNRANATRRERQIKQLSREEKLKMTKFSRMQD